MLKNKSLLVGFLNFIVLNNYSAYSIIVNKPLSICTKGGNVHFCGKGKQKGISQSDKENKAPITVKKTPSTPRKNKRTREAAGFIDLTMSPPKRQKVLTEEETVQKTPIFPPLLTHSPTSAERKFFSPLRRELAKKEYSDGNKKKHILDSPMVRKTFSKIDSGNYFSRILTVGGKTVAQADHLFDPYAEVLTEGTWKTNLERMKEGRCPIGHKGIVSKDEQTTLPPTIIKKRQNSYRVELHHVTQKDTGTPEDPICEMTHVAHMGHNARLILQFSETGELDIVHSSLEKKEAIELCVDGQFIETNVLHFRKGDSLIKREDFNLWRGDYWKARAANIEKGIFIGKEHLSTDVICKKLFHTPDIPPKNSLIPPQPEL